MNSPASGCVVTADELGKPNAVKNGKVSSWRIAILVNIFISRLGKITVDMTNTKSCA